jgi:hypothetical protein
MVVWLNVVHDRSRELFFNTDLHNWIKVNIAGDIEGIGVENWKSFWAIACHLLWTWHNKEEHDERFIRPWQPHKIIKRYMSDYKGARLVDNVISASPRTQRCISWFPPRDGWILVNTDGARKNSNNNNSCGCGGIIRGNNAEWLGGFAKGLGDCSVVVAELWGVLEGLSYAWRLRFRKVELHLDSKQVDKW